MEQQPRPAGRPPGYPREYERHVMLPGGRMVLIRPILPSDAPELAEALNTADADTLRRRFLGGPPRVTPALLARLTRVDYVRRFALVAIDPATRHGVAIAQYEPAGDGVAEIAIVVAPAWRRAGLAGVLVQLLAEAAADRGIHTFIASYFAENRPVAALLRDVSELSTQRIGQGIAECSVALDQDHAGAAHPVSHKTGR
jgi:RimJ/RimL family protein N-acetyltransferase